MAGLRYVGNTPTTPASIIISDTPPINPKVGDFWWDSNDGVLKIYYRDIDTFQWVDAATGVQGAPGPLSPASITIRQPSTTDSKVVMMYTPVALTPNNLTAVLPGGSNTPLATFTVRYGPNISEAGTSMGLFTALNNITTGQTANLLTSTIPAGSYIWVNVTSISGTVPFLTVVLTFT